MKAIKIAPDPCSSPVTTVYMYWRYTSLFSGSYLMEYFDSDQRLFSLASNAKVFATSRSNFSRSHSSARCFLKVKTDMR